ncbi:hypothetical protein D3C71_1708350 [compost metagenome]
MAARVTQRHQLDLHIVFAARRVVQVQHTLALPAQHGAGQRAGLARLVAGHRRVVRHLVAGAPDHWRTLSELAPVGCVGGHDAVLAVEQDVGLGQGVEVGSEFGQRGAAAMGGQWSRDHEDGA